MLFALTQCDGKVTDSSETISTDATTVSTTDDSTVSSEQEEVVAQPYSIAVDDMANIPSGTSITTFSLNSTLDAPELSSENLQAIQDVVDTIESTPESYSDEGSSASYSYGGRTSQQTNMSSVGFVMLDVDSGLGISYNVDQDVYTASTIKAAYVDYMLEEYGSDSFTNNIITCVENALTWSDNNSYYTLRETYGDDDFNQWMKGLGVDITQDDYLDTDPYYPRISARELTRLWANIYTFVDGGSDDAAWFESLMTETETSFIRDGIDASGVTVANKAGWIGEVGYNAVNDAAIVTTSDGHTYLMVIMSNQTDGEETEANVSDLASALFNARSTLNYDFSA